MKKPLPLPAALGDLDLERGLGRLLPQSMLGRARGGLWRHVRGGLWVELLLLLLLLSLL